MKNFLWKFMVIILSFLFMALAASGCGTTRKSTKTETVVISDTGPGAPAEVTDSQTKVVTTEENKEVKSDEPSIVGSVFRVIGEVLAFPFRVIAGLFDAIF